MKILLEQAICSNLFDGYQHKFEDTVLSPDWLFLSVYLFVVNKLCLYLPVPLIIYKALACTLMHIRDLSQRLSFLGSCDIK
jgi:hypothetical protein